MGHVKGNKGSNVKFINSEREVFELNINASNVLKEQLEVSTETNITFIYLHKPMINPELCGK